MSPVLATDALPNGGTLGTCPVSSSRRQRALDVLEGRDQAENEDDRVIEIECAIEDGVWGFACSGVCFAVVVTTSWM